MKSLKKLTLFALALSACFFTSAAVACGNKKDNKNDESSSVSDSVSPPDSGSNSGGEDENAPYVYNVAVHNAGGYNFKGVTVTLYDGETAIASKTTNVAGEAIFREADIPSVGAYNVVLTNLPLGYVTSEEEYKTVALSGTDTSVVLVPQGVMAAPMPQGTQYSLSDVMYDFTITDSDNVTHTLSEILQEKEVVLLNFWYDGCGPCAMEFPALNNFYLQYKDNVEVLAISTQDAKDSVASYKARMGLQFPMIDVTCGITLGSSSTSTFAALGTPTTVIIDRYGVVAYQHTGSITDDDDFIALYNQFAGADYIPTVIEGDGSSGDGGDSNVETDLRVHPTVSAPTHAQTSAAMGGASGFHYRFQPLDKAKYEEYSWPFIVGEENGESYMYSPIKGYHGNYAQMLVDFSAKTGDVIAFDYWINSEEKADIFYVTIDGVIIHEISGYTTDTQWKTCYAYVFRADDYKEEHELGLVYMKDTETSAGDDVVKIKNMRVLSVSDIENAGDSADIFRYAATEKNTDANAATQYKNYASVVLNETDGYYHVGEENGPLLFANMMFESLWNTQSLWLLAYNNYCIFEGFNFGMNADSESNAMGIIESYAWASNHNYFNYGYVPVNKDLAEWLQIAVETITVNQVWEGNYHDNEWLELCVYYEHYGVGDPIGDPIKNVTFHSATELHEGTNTVEVPFAMTPRGFKYKFIPEKTGGYHVYTQGTADPTVFLVAEDTYTFLGTWEDMPYADILRNEDGTPQLGPYGNELYDGNIEFSYYFEAGKTYYMLFTTYLDMTAEYEVVIEYLGASGKYLTFAATGPNSYNEVTNEEFVPDAIAYAYSDPEQGGDGFYHKVEENGSLGGTIYLDCLRTTAMFPFQSLKQICDEAVEKFDDITKRAFYVDGVDYTEDLLIYCELAARNTGELKGLIELDKDLLTILTKILSKYDATENAWQKLCYYYVYYGEAA